MFKTLLKVRFRMLFSQLFRGKKEQQKRSPAVMVLLGIFAIYIAASFLFMFGAMFMSVCASLADSGSMPTYFALAAILAFMLSFIGSVFAAQSQLFEAKDNELLLSMPIPPSMILASRMVMLYVLDLFYSALVLLPAGIVSCIETRPTAPGVVGYVLLFFFLPGLSLFFTCIFGWLIAELSKKLHSKNLITTILSLVFFAAYFYGTQKMQTVITYVSGAGETLTNNIRKYLYPFYCFGEASYNGSAVHFLLCAAICVIPFLIVYAVISHSFIGIATSNVGVRRRKYVAGEMHTSTPIRALTYKEVRRIFANSMCFLNAGMGTILTPVLAVMFCLNAGDNLYYQLSSAAIVSDARGVLFAMICMILCLVSCGNIFSASSVSLEGKDLWIVRSMPVDTDDVIMAKAYAHILVSLPSSIVGSLVMLIWFDVRYGAASAAESVLIFLLPVMAIVFCALWGLEMNLRFPKFDWISDVAAIKQSLSTFLAMFGSFIFLLPPAALCFFLTGVLSASGAMAVSAVYYLILIAIFLRIVRKTGPARFEALG